MRTPVVHRTYVDRTRLDLDTTTGARTISPSSHVRGPAGEESSAPLKSTAPSLPQSPSLPTTRPHQSVASRDTGVVKEIARSRPDTSKCGFCRGRSVGIVWGLRVCRWCGERINAVTPIGVCTGLGYLIAVCALAQWLRELRQPWRVTRRAA